MRTFIDSATVTMYHVITRDTPYFFLFFFNDTATTEIYTLSLHDALPIFGDFLRTQELIGFGFVTGCCDVGSEIEDRKSTRLNSSHQIISYAVFCLKKKTYSAKDQPGFGEPRPRTLPTPDRVLRATFAPPD